jgi:molybdopterin-guanine dinucleotide biosynthesis protein A
VGGPARRPGGRADDAAGRRLTPPWNDATGPSPGFCSSAARAGASAPPRRSRRSAARRSPRRAWRVLGEVADERLAVGKPGELDGLPFEVEDDGTDVRAPIAGLVAGLRLSTTGLVLALPVDCPLVGAGDLRTLAEACRDAAVPQTGPLPGAYRRHVLPALEAALAGGRLAIRDAIAGLDVAVVQLDPARLANANTPAELEALRTLA